MYRELPQFKTYLALVVALVVNECISYFGYVTKDLGTALFIVILACTTFITIRRLEHGLVILFAELFVGGKGYLYSVHIGEFVLSIRIALFCAVMLVWLIRYRSRFDWLKLPVTLRRLTAVLMTFIVWGIVRGIAAHHGLSNVYYDANAYLFFALLVVLLTPSLDWQRLKSNVIGVIAAVATVIGIKSLVSLGLFAHLGVSQLVPFYRWIRNTGVGEVAPIGHASYRVFFQSQIYGLLALFVLAPSVLPKRQPEKKLWWLFVPMTLGLSAVLVSLSRSFWLGGTLALVFGIIFAWKRFWWTLRQITAVVAGGAVMYLVAFTLTSWSLNFPYPFATAKTETLLAERFSHYGQAAVSSRMQMLSPLSHAIIEHPILGSGFAQTVTYRSSDPRQLQSPLKGQYTTDAFELGYLDIALKIGIIGLAVYCALLYVLSMELWKTHTVLSFGMLLGLIALIGVHLTTPYLNHPLGIGFILLAMTFGRVPSRSLLTV